MPVFRAHRALEMEWAKDWIRKSYTESTTYGAGHQTLVEDGLANFLVDLHTIRIAIAHKVKPCAPTDPMKDRSQVVRRLQSFFRGAFELYTNTNKVGHFLSTKVAPIEQIDILSLDPEITVYWTYEQVMALCDLSIWYLFNRMLLILSNDCRPQTRLPWAEVLTLPIISQYSDPCIVAEVLMRDNILGYEKLQVRDADVVYFLDQLHAIRPPSIEGWIFELTTDPPVNLPLLSDIDRFAEKDDACASSKDGSCTSDSGTDTGASTDGHLADGNLESDTDSLDCESDDDLYWSENNKWAWTPSQEKLLWNWRQRSKHEQTTTDQNEAAVDQYHFQSTSCFSSDAKRRERMHARKFVNLSAVREVLVHSMDTKDQESEQPAKAHSTTKLDSSNKVAVYLPPRRLSGMPSPASSHFRKILPGTGSAFDSLTQRRNRQSLSPPQTRDSTKYDSTSSSASSKAQGNWRDRSGV